MGQRKMPALRAEIKKPRGKRGAILTRNIVSNDEGPVKKNAGYGLAVVANAFGFKGCGL